MPMFVDRLEAQLRGTGEVCLAAPIVREHQAGRCELRLRVSMDRRPRNAARPGSPAGRPGRRRRRGEDRRPPAAATSTGTATSTGPPPA
jgi:hypothetical protein